jgi:hypothetical protein
MQSDQYLLVLSMKSEDEWSVEDEFFEQLINLSSRNYSSVTYHQSDFTHLVLSYILNKNGELDAMDRNFTYKVIKLSNIENVFEINPELDSIFRKSILEFEPPVYSSCHYLVEENGVLKFHQVSRCNLDDEITDDDHLDSSGEINLRPTMFYNHFYGKPYTDEQVVEITKMMLVLDSPMGAV